MFVALGVAVALTVGVVSINAASAADVTDPSVCVVEVSGSTATLSWFDSGGTNVIRRDGRWLASPGRNVSTFVDAASPPSASYVLRTWSGSSSIRSRLRSALADDVEFYHDVVEYHDHERADHVVVEHDLHHVDHDDDLHLVDHHKHFATAPAAYWLRARARRIDGDPPVAR